jgi:hypothetical protein
MDLNFVKRGIRQFLQHRIKPVDTLLAEVILKIQAAIEWSQNRLQSSWLVVLIGWTTFSKVGSLLPATSAEFDPARHMTRSDVKIKGNELLISIRFTKTRQFNDTTLTYPIPCWKNKRLDVESAWERLVAKNPAPESASDFSYATSSHFNVTPSYNTFITDLQYLCSKAVIKKRIGAHSLWQGGASSALKCGFSPILIKMMGDWASDCYLKYLEVEIEQRRNIATTLPHLSLIFLSSCLRCLGLLIGLMVDGSGWAKLKISQKCPKKHQN